MIGLNEYQHFTRETAVYPEEAKPVYAILGLVNEAGEVAGKFKKVLRGDKTLQDQRTALLDELGDVLWYLARAVDDLGYSLEDLAEDNRNKLLSRKGRNVLRGDGDTR